MTRRGGSALLMCLLVMAVALMLGLSGARIALHEERAARNDRDRKAAFQAAEAALLDAQRDIEQPASAGPRAALLASMAPTLPAGCGAGAANPLLGLCAGRAAAPAWLAVDFKDEGEATMRSVPYGRFTSQALPVGGGALPARRPRYLIEAYPDRRAGSGADLAAAGTLYHISAVGFGAQQDTQVLLQAWYQRASGR
jgi:type IV pilus assembly protein PilX